MKPEDLAENYNQIASHWNGEKFWRENGIAQHQRAFKFLKNKGNAIDIGCGSSGRVIDLFLEEGLEAEGLDISSEMLRFAKERHPQQIFYQADICEWELPKKYDFISAWDSIWHVPLNHQESVLVKLCEGLNDDGVCIFTSGGMDESYEATNPFLEQPLYHAILGIPKLLEIITESGCVLRHLEYDQIQQGELHIYLIIQKLGQ